MKLFLFSALMLLSAQASFAQKEIIVGDMNDDNELNIADVTSLVNTVIGKSDMRKISVGGSGGNSYGAYTTDNTDIVGTWYWTNDETGGRVYFTFSENGEVRYTDTGSLHSYYKYQPNLARIVYYNSNGSVNAVRQIAEMDANHFVMCMPQDQEFHYFYRDFTANMASPDMNSPEGWSQSGNWSAIENGITEAYGGWDANTNNDYNTHQTVTLAKGTYKLTGYAFYRSGVSYNTDPGTSLAYMYAGDKKVKVMTLGSIQRSSYPDNITETHTAFYTDGDYKNVLYFTVDEDNTEVEIGFKGVHDPNTSKSWFICGALNLEYLHDHEYVDLDLPSGTLWASMNIGANTPDEYGNYYAWGEVAAYGEAPYLSDDEKSDIADGGLRVNPYYLDQSPKTNFSLHNYKFANGLDYLFNNLSKYNNQVNYGPVDNITTLQLEDDAAFVNWGSDWRMPSPAEWEELINNCIWTYKRMGSHMGYKVTSKKDVSKFIFLPTAGYHWNERYDDETNYGVYWSNSIDDELCSFNSWYLSFEADGKYELMRDQNRHLGFSVRPVRRQ